MAAKVRNVATLPVMKLSMPMTLVAAREQQIRQVRAEKAGGAGDDGRWCFFAHAKFLENGA